MAARFQRERSNASWQGQGRLLGSGGSRWGLEGWSDFTEGWWSVRASTGVGRSKIGFGDGDWPGRLLRRVI